MNWSGLVAALMLAAAPVAAQQAPPAPSPTTPSAASAPVTPAQPAAAKLTLHGCVRAGADKDSVIVTDVTEVANGGRSALPTEAHGRKVIFWLDRDDALKAHVGRMVEVTGTPGAIEKSEVELKAGRQKEGGLVLEFEGPGKDVKAANADVGQALGTSGRTSPQTEDVKTFLLRVKVENVMPVAGTCR